MLRTKILDGLGCLPRQIVRAFDKFILRRDVDAESRAVTDHVKNILADCRGLADYTDAGGPGREYETVHFVVLLDDAGIGRARRQFHAHTGVERLDRLRLVVVAVNELFFARGLERGRRLRRFHDGLLTDGATDGSDEHRCRCCDPEDASNAELEPGYEHKVCNLTVAPMGVNETGWAVEWQAGWRPRC